MKGPMTTQSLRGMANHGPMHWRGDRTGGNDEPSVAARQRAFDEDAAFKKFNVGVHRTCSAATQPHHRDRDAGVHRLHPPGHVSAEPDPQPRQLAHAPTSRRAATSSSNDHELASRAPARPATALDPDAQPQSAGPFPGFFGTDGPHAFDAEPQIFKVPHLRNLYQKVGMFGMLNLNHSSNQFRVSRVSLATRFAVSACHERVTSIPVSGSCTRRRSVRRSFLGRTPMVSVRMHRETQASPSRVISSCL